ncbi:MAG: hypothetical protein F6K32_17690 [Desertifilum sp. SIO1I2]|nr:hypothetical protein [Desertifilum sp. SIO1I2]
MTYSSNGKASSSRRRRNTKATPDDTATISTPNEASKMSNDNGVPTLSVNASEQPKEEAKSAPVEKPATKSTTPEPKAPKNEPVALDIMKSAPAPLPLPNNRPIEPSHLTVVAPLTLAGNRPVMGSDVQVTHTFMASGNRPIASSQLHVDSTISIMGNRPIASNHIDDSNQLMGYLD